MEVNIFNTKIWLYTSWPRWCSQNLQSLQTKNMQTKIWLYTNWSRWCYQNLQSLQTKNMQTLHGVILLTSIKHNHIMNK